MRIKRNISFERLLFLLKLDAEITYNGIDSLPLIIGSNPKSIMDVTFRIFVESMKYTGSIDKAALFLAKITGLPEQKILKRKAVEIYPLYIHYLQSIQKIMQMFRDVNDELPSGKTPEKTMERYGLTNIVDFLTDGRPELQDYFYDKTTDWVLVEYMRKADKLINTAANNGKNT